MASATSGGIAFDVQVMAVSDGDAQDVDADTYATVNSGTVASVPGTAGYLDEVSITLSNDDSVAAGDFVVIRVARDVADAADTAAGDLELIGFTLEYTTS